MTWKPQQVVLVLALAVLAAGCKQAAKQGPPLDGMTRADHSLFLTIDSGSHAETACTDCHSAQDTTFTAFDCIHCHQGVPTDALHTKADLRAGSQACYACHRSGGAMDRAVHTIFFPIAASSSHAQAKCANCHIDASSRHVVNCGSCHAAAPTQASHAAVSGWTYDARGCLACHADGQVDRVANHRSYAITTGAHAAVNCLSCHAASRTDKPAGRDFTKFECTVCHTAAQTDPTHAAITGYARDSGACYGCHANGTTFDRTSHTASFFPIATGTTHGTATCQQCHADAANTANVSCGACHAAAETTTSHAALAGWTYAPSECLPCHGTGQVNRIAAHDTFPIAAGTPHARAGCLECHTSKRTDRPRAQNFDVYDCLTCHTAATTDPLHTSVTGYARVSTTCYGCHSAGAVVDRTAHSTTYFPISSGSHVGAACSGCHVNPGDRKVLDCTTCHVKTTATTRHALVGGFTTAGDACVVCHAESQVMRISAHSRFSISSGAHYRRACLTCHPGRRQDKPWAANFAVSDCLGCHTKAETDPDHRGRSGYSWTTAACLRCHPDGRE